MHENQAIKLVVSLQNGIGYFKFDPSLNMLCNSIQDVFEALAKR